MYFSLYIHPVLFSQTQLYLYANPGKKQHPLQPTRHLLSKTQGSEQCCPLGQARDEELFLCAAPAFLITPNQKPYFIIVLWPPELPGVESVKYGARRYVYKETRCRGAAVIKHRTVGREMGGVVNRTTSFWTLFKCGVGGKSGAN